VADESDWLRAIALRIRLHPNFIDTKVKRIVLAVGFNLVSFQGFHVLQDLNLTK
jgi:hypothetical protein